LSDKLFEPIDELDEFGDEFFDDMLPPILEDAVARLLIPVLFFIKGLSGPAERPRRESVTLEEETVFEHSWELCWMFAFALVFDVR
jgi:hypothetical protein